MLTSPLLQAKNEAQMRLDKEANHDIRRYFENSHHNVVESARKHGFTIQYGEIKGGYWTPTVFEESPLQNAQRVPEI